MVKQRKLIKLIKWKSVCWILAILCGIYIWTLIPNGLYWWFSDWLVDSNSSTPDAINLTKRGLFGDSFGGVNALFSGLAFLGIIIAIILQRQELRLQRQELKNQQKEMKEQRIAMQKETFERTFFHLLEAGKEQYNSTEHYQFFEVPYGEDGAQHQVDLHEKSMDTNKPDSVIVSEPFIDPEGTRGVNITSKGNMAFVAAIRNGMYAVDRMYLEAYFSLVFVALKLAHQIDFCETFEEKEFYTDILRGQMPDSGIQALCMYLVATGRPELCGNERDGILFKKLIEEYALFENIRGPNLIKELIIQYKRIAFGTNRPDIDKIFEGGQVEKS